MSHLSGSYPVATPAPQAITSTCRPFLEYFKCHPEFADFREHGQLSSTQGFFQFGDAICYGRSRAKHATLDVTGRLENALDTVRLEGNAVFLPFDLVEIIENLRFERYCSALRPKNQSFAKSLVRMAYYAVRPVLPVSVRSHLQRRALRTWDKIPFPRWPVDQTVDSIFETLMLLMLRAARAERVPFIWFWPRGHRAVATMTHDVETAAGRDFCGPLMDLNDSFGIKSSFQVVPEERYDIPKELLATIRNRGFEVNVHDLNHDGNLFRERAEFLRRVAKINKYTKEFGAVGYRSGVLYRNLDWYDPFQFSYDMSVPNVGHLDPQPGGCCTTKPYFIGDILEIPVTTTQDYTLFHIFRQYSTEAWKRQIQSIISRHGMANFIVHPDYVIESRARRVYSELLAHLAQLRRDASVWVPLPKEVNDWWRLRNQMTLVHRDGQWTIEGSGKEKACVAFAYSDEGKIEYEIPS